MPAEWAFMLLTPTRNQQLLLVGDPQSVAGPAHLVRTDRPARCPALLSSCSPAAGDRPDAAGRVTADDLIAVQLLSAQVPGEVAPDLLEGPLGDAVAHLRETPVDVAIDAPGAADLLAADAAWRLLRDRAVMSWVTTSQRPRLVPVYDTVVRSRSASWTHGGAGWRSGCG
jgi:hypothetical protein